MTDLPGTAPAPLCPRHAVPRHQPRHGQSYCRLCKREAAVRWRERRNESEQDRPNVVPERASAERRRLVRALREAKGKRQ